ncbi:hypothetical protein [Rhodovulum viride]|uniref:hypothetical protein n=1 Tax=Rhodovulum viride TaxID=1231134 RepID=UPI001FEC8177|nr:hypothetical protein [Rhodovulum viride]
MTANTAGSPGAVQALIRPELWDFLDGALIEGTAVSEWDRLAKNTPAGNIAMTHNALAAPSGNPLATASLLTTAAGGVAPIFIGAWGAVDMIRDPFSDAQSGGLRITALATMDLTVGGARGRRDRLRTLRPGAHGMTLAIRIYWRIAGRFNQLRAGRARAAARVFEARAEKFLARFKGCA